MRPGIKKFTEFEKGKLVCIVEETHHKFLAIGKSVVSSSELENMEKGELDFVPDPLNYFFARQYAQYLAVPFPEQFLMNHFRKGENK